jgi:hypothetical protein
MAEFAKHRNAVVTVQDLKAPGLIRVRPDHQEGIPPGALDVGLELLLGKRSNNDVLPLDSCMK